VSDLAGTPPASPPTSASVRAPPGAGARARGAPAPPFTGLLSPRLPVAAAPSNSALLLTDLNLDQVFRAVVMGKEEYDLLPLYEAPAVDLDTMHYRQEIARDLERPMVGAAARRFADGMREARRLLATAQQRYHELQQDRIYVDFALRYVETVAELEQALAGAPVDSRGLRAFRDYLRWLVASPAFVRLRSEATELRAAFGEITYLVHVRGRRVVVSPYREEIDLGASVEESFRRFAGSGAKEYRFPSRRASDLDNVEGEILDRVALLFPGPFGRMRRFVVGAGAWTDPVIRRFDREVQYFLAYFAVLERLCARGLAVCYPEVGPATEAESAEGIFDLALAVREKPEPPSIVINEFALQAPERIVVVTGPNQGGKTTFARAVGQLHFLAALGLPVPARSARLGFAERIFTHFGGSESLTDLRGRLEDDLVRMRRILAAATAGSLLILNESFASATVDDALLLGEEVVRQLIERGARAIYVTFLDELSRLSPETVSMVATVAPDDPNVRTYRIVRQRADGRAYAMALAEKHGLTYSELRRRIER
jgi:DNA mismatch repair protein MutS